MNSSVQSSSPAGSAFRTAYASPLLQGRTLESTIAWRNGKAIDTRTFLLDVHALAARLPPAAHVINLCEDPYWFLVGFAALLVNRQTSLMPPSRASRVIEALADRYPGSYGIHNGTPPDIGLRMQRVDDCPRRGEHGMPAPPHPVPQVADNHPAAILFTSGSTGIPRPHEKRWKDLVAGARMKQAYLGFGHGAVSQTLVATVPPQHMYGLEMSILNTLLNGVSLCTDRAFFPADLQAALRGTPGARSLVTTPTHLAACLASGLDWPALATIVSATAPLDRQLARQAEDAFNCPVLEIYGCTETGSLATRRTVEGEAWLLHEDVALREHASGHAVVGAHLPGAVPLQDVIMRVNDREFMLRGRHTDMIKVAGKRASLEDLNTRLRSIDGVQDAAFVAPGPDEGASQRPAALVVAPSLDAGHIRRELARLIDSAFLPRPLLLVDALPRNETGKLPRTALLEILRTARNSG